MENTLVCRVCKLEKAVSLFRPKRHVCKKCVNKKDHAKNRSKPVDYLLGKARVRARQLGLPFDLSAEDIIIPPVCPIFGLVLKQNTHKAEPNSITLDRIDNTKGYVKGNVAVISFAANALKKDYTIPQIVSMSKNLLLYVTTKPGLC